jgi:hypothetical protein
MSRPTITQREWLLEDLDQVRRYFPGAEVLEVTETPFDIRVQSLVKVQTYAQHRRERKVSGGVRAVGEQSDAGTRRGARPSLKMNALCGVIL